MISGKFSPSSYPFPVRASQPHPFGLKDELPLARRGTHPSGASAAAIVLHPSDRHSRFVTCGQQGCCTPVTCGRSDLPETQDARCASPPWAVCDLRLLSTRRRGTHAARASAGGHRERVRLRRGWETVGRRVGLGSALHAGMVLARVMRAGFEEEIASELSAK